MNTENNNNKLYILKDKRGKGISNAKQGTDLNSEIINILNDNNLTDSFKLGMIFGLVKT